MTSREEYRQQQNQQQGTDSAEVSAKPRPQNHLRIRTIIGFAIVGWLFLTSFWLYRTIFNKQFAVREAGSTAVADSIDSAVDSALEQYNLPHTVLTKKETNNLVKQAVSDVYDNQRISLNLSPITNQLQSSVSGTLSEYGIDTSALSGNSVNMISSQLSSAVNDKINNDAVKNFTTGLHEATLINLAVMAVSGILVVVQIVAAIFRRTILRLLAWGGLLATALFAVTITMTRQIVLEATQALPDLSSSVVGVVKDVATFGWHVTMIAAAIAIISLVGHIFIRLRG